MMTGSLRRGDHDQNLDEVLAAYLKDLEAGRAPDRAELLARYPALAEGLAEFFADLDQFEQAAAPLRVVGPQAGAPKDETVNSLADPNRTGPYSPAPPEDPTPTGPFPRPPTPGGRRETPAIPGYEVLGILGRGGMGVVYQARQMGLKRLVALKMIRAGAQADDAELARFRVEAEAVARLQHPNIVQIYEIGDFQGQPFCSLEYVAGGTLGRHLAGTPQPPRQAALLARTLARAMDAAHRCGIVHRDLKPANVLIAEDGSPKITDIGLAKCLDEDAGHTSTGAIMGTPAYMAPEQALGQKEVGPLADVYALGVILYEMLTGRPPFKAATVLETLEQVRHKEPVAVRLLEPKVPRDLETVCLKCLPKEPRKRYATAGALAEDLERWLDGRPILARRTGVAERGYRWVRRNPVVAGLAALAAFVTLVGLGSFAYESWQTQAALEEARNSLYFQRISNADRYAAEDADRAEVLLDLCSPELRHWEWHYLRRRCHANWRRLQGHTAQVRCVAYSRDGTRVASGGNDETARIWDPATGRELHSLRGHGGWVNNLVFHDDGKRLVSASENGVIKIWDVATGQELQSLNLGLAQITISPDAKRFGYLEGPGLAIFDLETGKQETMIPGHITKRIIAFSPDGRQVTATLDAALRIWDTRTGRENHLLLKHAAHAYNLRFSPDGGRLFVALHERGYPVLKVWDTATGREWPHPLSSPLTIYGMAISPDGQSIVTGGQEGALKIRDVTTGRATRTMPSFPEPVVSLAYRPDGQALAVGTGRDLWLRDWSALQLKGPITLTNQAEGMGAVVFNPNGTQLAACGDTDRVRVWDARTGKLIWDFRTPTPGLTSLSFHPDAHRLLAFGRNGGIFSWNLTTGQPAAAVQIPNHQLTDAAFSPDGKRIATAGMDRTVAVWDAATGTALVTCGQHDASVWGVRFSPDGSRIASAGGDGQVRLWEAMTGRDLGRLTGHLSYVQCVAFHPEGRLLASGSVDETVRLWDVRTGQSVHELQGHTGPVRGLTFTPDGRRLASAGEDGTVHLWDVATGQEALTLADPGKVRGVTFSPDGWRLAAASSDGTIKIWDATPAVPER